MITHHISQVLSNDKRQDQGICVIVVNGVKLIYFWLRRGEAESPLCMFILQHESYG